MRGAFNNNFLFRKSNKKKTEEYFNYRQEYVYIFFLDFIKRMGMNLHYTISSNSLQSKNCDVFVLCTCFFVTTLYSLLNDSLRQKGEPRNAGTAFRI